MINRIVGIRKNIYGQKKKHAMSILLFELRDDELIRNTGSTNLRVIHG